MIVELKYAGIPRLGLIAVHYWFVTTDKDRRDRWEVWQRAGAGGESIGHLHRNLMRPDSNVGGSPTQLEKHWDGDQAERIVTVLRRSWEEYPYRTFYRALPGPNSNTFVAWVLREATIAHRLSWKGIGKQFLKSA